MVGSVCQEITLQEKEFERISQLVYKYCGINLHDGKRELVRARLAKRLRYLKIPCFSDYIDYAVNDTSGNEFTLLIDSISTNLTSFYREKQHFDYLESTFYPKITKKKMASGKTRIRAWSAGCSSGEEPYTIGLTLLDYFSKQAGNWDMKILATDISTKVLDKAKAGLYEKARVMPVPQSQKSRYLIRKKDKTSDQYQAGDELRRMIFFGRLNLMEEWPIQGPLDFIFCRNVMIYFDKPTQERLVNRYWNLLDSGGLLFTGHSESLTGINHKFKYVQPTIYAKP